VLDLACDRVPVDVRRHHHDPDDPEHIIRTKSARAGFLRHSLKNEKPTDPNLPKAQPELQKDERTGKSTGN